ncbi:MAG: amidohydrolase family protein, partial [Verrucomicrobiota bacterium]|nr:amidohydrolase family protein [Verrucomicrobiota bacterium]
MIHTVSGKTFSGDVLIKDGKIKGVGEEMPLFKHLPVSTDLKGLHLYPGLIALNTSLGLSEIGAVRSTRDETEVGDFTPDVQSWIAINPDSELIPVARANGITHIEPAPQGGVVSGQSAVVVLAGWTSEQMAIKKPAALHVFWPAMELDFTPKEKFKDQKKWKSLEDQVKQREEKLKALEDFFSEARAYDKAKNATNSETKVESNPSWEAMLPVVRSEIPMMIHANEIRQINAAIKWADTNRFKIILVGARDGWKVAELLAKEKIPVIYENIFTLPEDTESYEIHFKAPELLRKAGVKTAIGMGADPFNAALIKNLPYAAAQAIAFGLPEEEALKSITLYPAEFLGVTNRLGSIEVGKDATFFVADGNIFDIRSQVKRVWISGKEINLENRHTRLYEKYKN